MQTFLRPFTSQHLQQYLTSHHHYLTLLACSPAYAPSSAHLLTTITSHKNRGRRVSSNGQPRYWHLDIRPPLRVQPNPSAAGGRVRAGEFRIAE